MMRSYLSIEIYEFSGLSLDECALVALNHEFDDLRQGCLKMGFGKSGSGQITDLKWAIQSATFMRQIRCLINVFVLPVPELFMFWLAVRVAKWQILVRGSGEVLRWGGQLLARFVLFAIKADTVVLPEKSNS